jgi:hypothetical protein
VDPAAVDAAWLFPPRTMGGRESGVAVVSSFAGGGVRTIHTVAYETEPRAKGPPLRRDSVQERGSVPIERLEAIIEGVLRRLDRPEAPEFRPIAGDAVAWGELLAELRGEEVDGAYRESLSFGSTPDAERHPGGS